MASGTFYTGLVLVPLGCAFAWLGWRQLNMASASASWPQTSGVITAAKLKKLPHDEGNAKDYKGIVTYEYAVGDAAFSCSTIAIGKETVELTTVESLAFADRYPLQGAVTVYYDPTNPARAVLEPGEQGHSVLIIALGGAAAIAGLVMLL